jgi:transcriptional regulator with XRE-family HTH domain
MTGDGRTITRLMPRRGRTRLSEARAHIGFSQEEMAERTGISLRTYQRLESGRVENPPLRYLVNCAIALGVELDDILEPEWLEWLPLTEDAAKPPARPRMRLPR